MRKIAFTSITNNYLPKARALAHSVKRHAPEVSFVLLLAEDVDKSLLRPDDPFDAFLTVKELGIPDLDRWLFNHTVVEVCTAIKGPAMVKLLGSDENCAVLYFDPDMIVTSSLEALFANFDDGASILLTPHVTQPATTLGEILDNEISPLRYGVYNLGFLGVRNTTSGLKFADWWARRLHDFCYDDIENGIFTDQRWVDLAPAMFEGVNVLRDPGYNVATWNLAHRVVTGSLETGLTVNERPLVFYHFSGFDSGAQEIMLDKYGQQSPILKDFREWYINECRRLGQDQLGTLPWTYSKFANHEPITNAQRKLYRTREDLQHAFPDPFSTQNPNQSYFHWYLHNGEKPPARVVPRDTSCRILVLALDEGIDQVENVQALISKTAQKSAIEIVGTGAVCKKLSGALPGLRFVEISEAEAAIENREFWMLNQIAEAKEKGLIFIQLGLRVPQLWDLRLHWNAAREPGIVTVSPLYDGLPMTSPVNVNEGAVAIDPEEIDTAVFNSHFQTPNDAPVFLYECFYVNTLQAQAVAQRYLREHRLIQRRPGLVGFARQCMRDGFSHVIANNIYVATITSVGHRDLIKRLFDPDAHTYLCRNVLFELRNSLKDLLKYDRFQAPSVNQRSSRRHLHVMHSWGGGLENWVRSFCRSDAEHVNMVLKPTGPAGAYGSELALYAHIDDAAPIARWGLPLPIKATSPSNWSYRRIIKGIVKDYGIDVVLVSTLIGHSFDVLKTEASTVVICHDHFPLTPEIYVRSDELLGNRVIDFSVDKVYDRGPVTLFPNYSRSEARLANKKYREILARRTIKIIAPSPSARQIYLDLAPELNPRDITVIPHGTAPNILAAPRSPYESKGKLRIVIPGTMSAHKGRALLENVIPGLTAIADILLLGCSLEGLSLADAPGVQAIDRYEHDTLPEILRHFKPHIGLLLSNVPETFSFMLDELLTLGIPPVAVRIGSLADRITEGLNGFLVENSPAALLEAINHLDQNRDLLESVRRALENMKRRTEAEMISDYELLLSLPRYSERAINAKALDVSAYKQISREMNRHVLLTERIDPSIQTDQPEYYRLEGDSIFLHPPGPGAPDTEVTFAGVPFDGALKLTAEIFLNHELSPKVDLSALVRDSETGRVLGQATMNMVYGHRVNLEIALKNGSSAHRADITFSSRIHSTEATNHCAWLMVSKPQIAYA
jgi:glycosyltransferase involved in cell wall biosynthesis